LKEDIATIAEKRIAIKT